MAKKKKSQDEKDFWRQFNNFATEIDRSINYLLYKGVMVDLKSSDMLRIYLSDIRSLSALRGKNTDSYREIRFIDRMRDLISVSDAVSKKMRATKHLYFDHFKIERGPHRTSDIRGYDAFNTIVNRSENISHLIEIYLGKLFFDPVLDIPNEMPAPIRVAVSDDRIVLTSPQHKSGPLAEKSIEIFRRSACDILDEIIAELAKPSSNADPRLNPRLMGLRDELNVPLADMAVEAVGLQWQVTGDVVSATQETIPDVLLPQIQRILTTVRNLLAQYDEWNAYEALSVSQSVSQEDAKTLVQIGDLIAEDTSSSAEVIDAKIGQRFHSIAEALSTGFVKIDSLIAPTIGGLSNFFAAISHYVLENAPAVIKMAANTAVFVTDTSNMGRCLLLLGASLHLIKKYAPKLMQYEPFKWLGNVHAAAIKYYDQLKDASGKGDK